MAIKKIFFILIPCFIFTSCSNGMFVSDDSPYFDASSSIVSPSLVYPSHNSSVTSANPLFSWRANSNTIKFNLEVSRKSDFSTKVIDVDLIEENEYQVPANLSLHSGTYYWRVQSVDASNGLSGFSEVWAVNIELSNPFILGTIPSNGNSNVALNTSIVFLLAREIEQGINLEEKILLRKQEEDSDLVAGIAIYDSESNQIIFTPDINLDSNQRYSVTFLGGVKDINGNEIQSYAFYFETGESIDVVPPEVVVSNPTNATTEFPINANMTIVFNEDIFSTTINKDNFLLVDLKGNPIEVNLSYDANSKIVTLNPVENLGYKTIYRLMVTNLVSDLSGNRLSGNYEVYFETAKIQDYAAPNSPELINPADRNTLRDSNITFIWDGTDDSVGYILQLSTDSDFKNIILDVEIISQKEYRLPAHIALSDGTYYWRVKAKDNCGNWSDFTSAYSFIIRSYNTSILKTIPSRGESGVVISQKIIIFFNNNLEDESELNNLIQLRENNSDGARVSGTITYNSSQYALIFSPETNLNPSQSYYVYFAGGIKDAEGVEISSYAFTFETGTEPDILAPWVSSSNPINGSREFPINASILINFSENIFPETINTDNFILSTLGGTEISKTISYDIYTRTVTISPALNLKYESIYRFVVSTNVADLSGNHMESEYEIAFETAKIPDYTPPDPPMLLSPTNGESTVDANPEFVWSGSDDSVRYRFQISGYPSFSSTILDIDTLSDRSFTMPIHLLLYEGNYYWRVKAADRCTNWSEWSEIFSFRVVPTTPHRSSPAATDVCTSTTPDLSWEVGTADVTNYRVQIARDPAFADVILERGGIIIPELRIPEDVLSPGIYQWRIRSEVWEDGKNIFNSRWSSAVTLNIKQIAIQPGRYQEIKSEDLGLKIKVYPNSVETDAVINIEKYVAGAGIEPFRNFTNPSYRISTPVYRITSNRGFLRNVGVEIMISEAEMADTYGTYSVDADKLFYKHSHDATWLNGPGSYISVSNGNIYFKAFGPLLSTTLEEPTYIVGASDIELHCSNEKLDAAVGELGVDCGGICPSVCVDCNGYDFGHGPESYLYSFGDPDVIAAANNALAEYAEYKDKEVSELDVYEKMEAMGNYVGKHMRWMRDEGDWEGSQTARITVVESSGRTGWYVGKENKKWYEEHYSDNPDELPAFEGHCTSENGVGGKKDILYCGDCEDHAILRASLMRHVGINQNCIFIADYHDDWCHRIGDEDCMPDTFDTSALESEEGVDESFDIRFMLFGAPEGTEASELKKGSHSFNIMLYKNKFRVLDFYGYNTYFRSPSSEEGFSYYHHAADNIWSDYFGNHWSGTITNPEAVVRNYNHGPTCYEEGRDYWTHFTFFNDICP